MSIFDTKLVLIRCWKCDVEYGMNERIHAQRKNDKESFYCTNGHSAAFVESEADKLRRERDRLTQRLAEKDDQIKVIHDQREAAERRASAAAHSAAPSWADARACRTPRWPMNTGMAGVYMIYGFLAISGTLLFWKLIAVAIDEMKYRNNRD